ncbi:MAG: GIY-YIG nuclease family protein [Dokdonella sp.]
MTEDPPYPRSLSKGRAFAYLLPCRHEDIAKIGFSRDPLVRVHTLHRRYFEFFDLDRAVLVETDRVRDARRIERRLIADFSDYLAPAPLLIPDSAGGRTEWYRGAFPAIRQTLHTLAESDALVLHDPMNSWLRTRIAGVTERMHGWAADMREAIEYAQHNLADDRQSKHLQGVLCDVLDAHVALGIDVQTLVPTDAWTWYRDHSTYRVD